MSDSSHCLHLHHYRTCNMCNHSQKVDSHHLTIFCQGCNWIEYCRMCHQRYHPAMTCDVMKKEVHRKKDPRHVAEEAMTETVIRRCPKCDSRFVKEDGCNKVTCSTPGCGTMICYLCKLKVDNYDHFCRNSDRKSPNQPCPDPDCNKKCILRISNEALEELEKEWKLRAGRDALTEHGGVTDSAAMEEIINMLLAI